MKSILSNTQSTKRGLTTISPPAKVIPTPGDCEILASGVDTLALAIDVEWKDPRFLSYLAGRKQTACDEDRLTTVLLESPGNPVSPFNIKKFGVEGYKYLLNSNEFSLKIGDWEKPKIQGRPSIMATFRSVALWQLGPKAAVDLLLQTLEKQGAKIVSVRVSRIDLCVDTLMRETDWMKNLGDFAVTRAQHQAEYSSKRKFIGLAIGKGKIAARLYDKPEEIRQKFNEKAWFYKIWGIKQGAIPEGCKIIRVEFQLRREALKELGIDRINDFFEKSGALWKYCSEKWLKFRSRPGEHHNLRKTFPWWKTVQNGFDGAQGQNPLVREKADRISRKQLFSQIKGLMTSLHALDMEQCGKPIEEDASLNDCISTFRREAIASGIMDADLDFEVYNKRSKYHRLMNPKGDLSEKPKAA